MVHCGGYVAVVVADVAAAAAYVVAAVDVLHHCVCSPSDLVLLILHSQSSH